MKKQELEQKLNSIDLKLEQLGDLNSLVSGFKSQKQQLDTTVRNATAQQQNINQIPIKKSELDVLVSEAHSLKEELNQNIVDSEEVKNRVEELEKKIDETDDLAREQLGIISNEKLSNSFDIRSADLITEKKKWFRWLIGSTISLLVAIGLIVWWQTINGDSIFELSFLVKIALTSPIIFFEFFVSREYSRSQELLEEYQFKASVARSFEAYKEIIEESFSDRSSTAADFDEKKLDFILETIKSLYISPMKSISDNNQKGLSKKESSSLLSDIKNTVSDVRSIVGR